MDAPIARAGRARWGYSSERFEFERLLGSTSGPLCSGDRRMSFKLDERGGEGIKPIKSAWLKDVPMAAATAIAVLVATSLAVFAFLA